MNRYEILIGKEPPEYIMGVDVGSGDSTSVWAATQPDGNILFNEDLDRLIENLSDLSVAVTRRDVPPPTFITPPAMVRIRVNENLQVGDLLGADGQGNIRRIVPGLVPVGIVMQPTSQDGTIVMRTCTTDELLQYTRRIEEANNRAQSAAEMARNYEETSARETRQIVPESDRSEALFRLAEQMGMVGVDTTSIVNEAQRIADERVGLGGGGDPSNIEEAPSMGHLFIHDGNSSSGVSGVSGSPGVPSHLGTLHEHPKMQQNLRVPNDHVIVDRNEWRRARQRRGNR
jgi:hypothetical protein